MTDVVEINGMKFEKQGCVLIFKVYMRQTHAKSVT